MTHTPSQLTELQHAWRWSQHRQQTERTSSSLMHRQSLQRPQCHVSMLLGKLPQTNVHIRDKKQLHVSLGHCSPKFSCGLHLANSDLKIKVITFFPPILISNNRFTELSPYWQSSRWEKRIFLKKDTEQTNTSDTGPQFHQYIGAYMLVTWTP